MAVELCPAFDGWTFESVDIIRQFSDASPSRMDAGVLQDRLLDLSHQAMRAEDELQVMSDLSPFGSLHLRLEFQRSAAPAPPRVPAAARALQHAGSTAVPVAVAVPIGRPPPLPAGPRLEPLEPEPEPEPPSSPVAQRSRLNALLAPAVDAAGRLPSAAAQPLTMSALRRARLADAGEAPPVTTPGAPAARSPAEREVEAKLLGWLGGVPTGPRQA